MKLSRGPWLVQQGGMEGMGGMDGMQGIMGLR
jgi:hypothetical protein